MSNIGTRRRDSPWDTSVHASRASSGWQVAAVSTRRVIVVESAARRSVFSTSTDIVQQLRARDDEICQGIYDHIRKSVSDSISDANPAYQQGMRMAIAALVNYVLDGIAAGGHWTQPIPRPAVEQARRAARAGVSLGLILRRYVAAHARLSEFIAEQAAQRGVSNDGFTLQHLRRAQETLLEQLTEAIEHEYSEERERLDASPDQARRTIVCRLLRHEQVSRPEMAKLDYGLEHHWHIGVLASGASERLVYAAKDKLRCEVLAVVSDDGPIWAWLGSEHRISAQLVIDRLSDSRACLAIGEPRLGIDGWRRTHGEALAAWSVAVFREARVIHCASVTLDAALLGNNVLARLHQETYLEPLDNLRDGGRTARKTLHAYFSCEESIASTSAKLNVTRRTVENRLAAISRSLRRPLNACLPEMQVALRLEALTAREADLSRRSHGDVS
jgi:PucR-like helix-turn-helix protein